MPRPPVPWQPKAGSFLVLRVEIIIIVLRQILNLHADDLTFTVPPEITVVAAITESAGGNTAERKDAGALVRKRDIATIVIPGISLCALEEVLVTVVGNYRSIPPFLYRKVSS